MKRRRGEDVVPSQPAIALSAAELAVRMRVSLRHIRRCDAAQLLPKPIRLGRAVRWPISEITAWLEAGAPDRMTWERMLGEQK